MLIVMRAATKKAMNNFVIFRSSSHLIKYWEKTIFFFKIITSGS